MSTYARPVPLTPDHQRDSFRSGHSTLDSWLRNRALKNEDSGASRSFVTFPTGHLTVSGYYTLAASAVAHDRAPGSVRRNMPQPIPVILLGRLAVDERHQGAGLGASLLQDAVLRVAGAAELVGVRALLVHAIDEAAVSFYRHFGFTPSPIDEATLFLTMHAINASIQRAGSP